MHTGYSSKMETVSYREKKLREAKLKHIIIILSGSVATLAGPVLAIDDFPTKAL